MSKKGRNLYFEDEMVVRKFSLEMLGKLLSYGKKYTKTYVKVFFFLILNSILSMIPSVLNMFVINKVLPQDGVLKPNFQIAAVIILTTWTAVLIGQIITSYINSVTTVRLGNQIVCELRDDMFKKLMELSFDYYDSRPSGKILVRITSYADEISQIFINQLTTIVVNFFTVIFTVIMICIMEIHLAFCVFLVEIPLLAIAVFLMRMLQKKTRISKNKNSNRTAFVAEDISGVDVIKAFNREDLNGNIIYDLIDQCTHAFMQETHYREAVFPLAHGGIRLVCIIVIYGVSLYMITGNPLTTLTLGLVVSLTTYVQQFADALYNLCQLLQNITTLTTNMERIFELLGEEPAIRDAEDAGELPQIKGEVRFEDVSFSYVEDTPVLEHVSFEAKPGEMIALVGPTGGGKTTIVSLLSRFYDIQSGKILIDGHDISKVTLNSLRSQIGVMMQDTFLFSREIIENIRFSRPDATDEECIAAAKAVSAHEFIMKMPNGYHTVLSHQGSELSGGQRQLLSFARLILADPKIIILDEATSNIDSETEAKIQEMMNTVLKGRTSFVIAHRLGTIKNADRILYICDRKIAESGSHRELMKRKGYYYELLNRQ
jgi:ATP-binding cassette subfamily B protein